MFLTANHMVLPLMLASALLGLLQGADVSIFGFFVAHRFDVSRYGTIFGAMHGMGWIGTAAGVIGFGASFDHFHGYWFAQSLSIAALLLAAMLIPLIRLPARDHS
jgi:MFS family permease